MITLSGSVGRGGANQKQDVILVQTSLNEHLNVLPGRRKIDTDGLVGPATIAAIKAFQQHVVGLRPPDGRVDPGGKTLARLVTQAPSHAQSAATDTAVQPIAPEHGAPPQRVEAAGLFFPLRQAPRRDYRSGGREFSCSRSRSVTISPFSVGPISWIPRPISTTPKGPDARCDQYLYTIIFRSCSKRGDGLKSMSSRAKSQHDLSRLEHDHCIH
jgi:hypothetical protein